MATDEIDLYGNIEDDYVEESNDFIELYDDAVGSPKPSKPRTTETSEKQEPPPRHPGFRISAYVGNLTWWTTDVDIREAFKSIGVDDIIEIKFHENRQNGQSKGFCVVVFASHHSMDLAKSSLPKLEIHGRNPVVANCNRANLSLFDKNISSDHDKGGGGGSYHNNHHNQGSSHHNNSSGHHNSNKNFNNANTIFNSLRNQSSFNGMRGGGSGASLNMPPPSFGGSNFLPTSIPPPGINPLALNMPILPTSNSLPMQRLDGFGRSSHDLKISDVEFEDILQRNKTVASTAIHRAVQDASCGDVSNAVSTLKTAISLIKQSRISDDDRCKLLINSLSDTLSGIESKSSKSSNHKSSRRRRSYSGSDSGDDYQRRSRHRSRSRSRDRHDSRGSRRYRDDRGSSGRVEYFGSSSGGNHSGRSYR